MSDTKVTQAHVDIVVAGFAAEKSDDDIIREIFETGAEFKDLRPIFNEVVASQGLRLSAKERKTLTTKTLDGWSPETSEDVATQSTDLAAILKISEPKALTAIRAWAKEAKVELPKPERKARVLKVGFSGHMRTMLDYAMENRGATREQLTAHANASEVPVNYVPFTLNVIEFANEYNPQPEAKAAKDKKAA